MQSFIISLISKKSNSRVSENCYPLKRYGNACRRQIFGVTLFFSPFFSVKQCRRIKLKQNRVDFIHSSTQPPAHLSIHPYSVFTLLSFALHICTMQLNGRDSHFVRYSKIETLLMYTKRTDFIDLHIIFYKENVAWVHYIGVICNSYGNNIFTKYLPIFSNIGQFRLSEYDISM